MFSVSLQREKSRRTFLVFFSLSSLLPLLITLFVTFHHVYPVLHSDQISDLSAAFTYMLIVMAGVSILGFFLMARLIDSLENLAREIRSKPIPGGGEKKVGVSVGENEMMTIQEAFNDLHIELKEKVDLLNAYSNKLIDSNRKLAAIANTDQLTALFNRRYFDRRLIEETSRADRYRKPLSLIMIDVDGFKAYNDAFGHPAGDRLLKALGMLIRGCVRKSDIAVRYGGDEFAILLPESDAAAAKIVAAKLIEFISKEKISISCGIAEYGGNSDMFLQEADRCLYKAKKAGKGKVVDSDGVAGHLQIIHSR